MTKSPDAFRTISEVAEEIDTPAHVLRFWESRFPQIKPLKRGGGRRYYRPQDVALLNGIRVLLYTDGFTIKGVQKVLREQGVKSVIQRGQEVDSLDGATIESDADHLDIDPGSLDSSVENTDVELELEDTSPTSDESTQTTPVVSAPQDLFGGLPEITSRPMTPAAPSLNAAQRSRLEDILKSLTTLRDDLRANSV